MGNRVYNHGEITSIRKIGISLFERKQAICNQPVFSPRIIISFSDGCKFEKTTVCRPKSETLYLLVKFLPNEYSPDHRMLSAFQILLKQIKWLLTPRLLQAVLVRAFGSSTLGINNHSGIAYCFLILLPKVYTNTTHSCFTFGSSLLDFDSLTIYLIF
ncbi:unnamed protein product [Trichobilharzia szidati]|nr:unnamed protein product [Trichobilharzia szidati]